MATPWGCQEGSKLPHPDSPYPTQHLAEKRCLLRGHHSHHLWVKLKGAAQTEGQGLTVLTTK